MPIKVGTDWIGRMYVGENIPSWSPADIARYWWTADAGITESGGNVSAWEDQVGGLVISQPTSANQPTIVTSTNLNNQQAVRFTRANSEYMFRDPLSFSGVGYAFTIINIIYVTSTSQQGFVTQTIAAGSAGRYAFNIQSSGDLGYVAPNFSSTNVLTEESPATTGIKVGAFEYDGAGNVRTWFNDFSSPSSYSGGSTNQDLYQSTDLAFGVYYNASGTGPDASRYMDGDLAESIWVTGTLSAGDISNLQTYINNKYGTSV